MDAALAGSIASDQALPLLSLPTPPQGRDPGGCPWPLAMARPCGDHRGCSIKHLCMSRATLHQVVALSTRHAAWHHLWCEELVCLQKQNIPAGDFHKPEQWTEPN